MSVGLERTFDNDFTIHENRGESPLSVSYEENSLHGFKFSQPYSAVVVVKHFIACRGAVALYHPSCLPDLARQTSFYSRI